MVKKLVILLLFSISLASCSDLRELNEKAKGDGVPYIPGI
tara:strand:+ start:558 stop:677 length:120 start_codon:yes stop_codon:yes gene_type:complete